MIRKAIRGHIENNKALENLLPLVKGNMGFVFVKDDCPLLKKVITESRVSNSLKNFRKLEVRFGLIFLIFLDCCSRKSWIYCPS